jgi:hypothetical protein
MQHIPPKKKFAIVSSFPPENVSDILFQIEMFPRAPAPVSSGPMVTKNALNVIG